MTGQVMTDQVEERTYRWPRRCLLLLTVLAIAALIVAVFLL
jgi:hypothetical protein